MPTTLTKFMALGLSVEQVLQRATIEPARPLPAERGHGRLAEGLAADIGLFAIEAGEFTYHDFFGNPLQAGRRLICRGTIKDGLLLTPETQEPMPFNFMRR
jgi:dihydroorotase